VRRTQPRGLPGQFSLAAEVSRIRSLTAFEQQLLEAECAALENTSIGEGTTDELSVASVALGPLGAGRRATGLITIGRRDKPFDIDNFKSVNDRYGHPQGDVVLKQVARILREHSRETDAPARYGGEAMALIAEADTVFYAAKRRGKNRTVRAAVTTANVSGGE
jgi:hypothetical protein